MRHWKKRLFALSAPLLLTGCLWGPGKFTSDLVLRKDGSFVLNYRGEVVLNLPPEKAPVESWRDERAQCFEGMPGLHSPGLEKSASPPRRQRPCTAQEIASQRADYERDQAQATQQKNKQVEEVARMFGLQGLDDESGRAFAFKLMKYAGWRSVTYRGHGIFDVDYHMAGTTKQDFVFPTLPDDDLILPFVAIRRRADGSILVTAPSFTGGAGPLIARMGSVPGDNMKTDMISHAEGRFTVETDGEILTNNSEDGPAPHAIGRQLHWDVSATSTKIPETLIRL